MQELRGTGKEEYESVISLINRIFREDRGFAPTMHLEYPLLLCHENMDNMRIIREDGRPVSTVSYYTSDIIMEGASWKAASVGSVCTHPDYRGRNYATLLMDDVEARMKANGVEIMLVSGDRELYKRRGCTSVGGFYRAELQPVPVRDEIALAELNPSNMDRAARLYNREPVRFQRSYDQFVRLQRSVAAHRNCFDCRPCLVMRRGKAVAYIVAKIVVGANTALIREFAGDRRAVLNGIYKLMEQQGLGQCTLVFPQRDLIGLLLDGDGVALKPQDQQGTVKIMDFVSLMNGLRPYMKQYLPDKTVDGLSFLEEGGKYSIALEDETVAIDNRDLLGQLIFGRKGQDSLVDSFCQKELVDKLKIKSVLYTVFPVPFPWTENLNYV